jgi:hypothetical protein
VTYQKQ